MKRIYAKEDVCMGCKLCEIYCIVEHSESKDIIKAFKEEYPRALARTVVETKRPVSFALQCRHCEDAPCVQACMSGAMTRDKKTGEVKHNKDKCIGCWMCVMVCPYGVIKRDTEGKKVISKCDLCPDEEIPVCVKNCPNEALVYEEKKDSGDEK